MAHWADPLKDWGDVLVKQGNAKDALAKYDETPKVRAELEAAQSSARGDGEAEKLIRTAAKRTLVTGGNGSTPPNASMTADNGAGDRGWCAASRDDCQKAGECRPQGDKPAHASPTEPSDPTTARY
jgi:hypothetical protein